MNEPTVAAGILKGIARFAVARGADERSLLSAAKIDPLQLDDPDARLPISCYRALIKTGQELTGDPAFALHYAEIVDLSEVSIVGLIGLASETMIQGFTQIQRYTRLMTEVECTGTDRFEVVPRGQELWLVDTRLNPNAFPEHTEIAFAQMICGSRPFGVTSFAKEIRITYDDPGYGDEYERILGAPVHFGSHENAICLNQQWLRHPLPRPSRYAFGVFSERADALLESLERSVTTRGRVEALIMRVLHAREATVERVARELGFSRQTLFRKLKAEGTSFEKVLDELRHRLALHYLDGGKANVSDTAYLLGFSDTATFSRAFKRWTGASPRAGRR
jgi:AraC-like DNA-binding protein